jgi:hypothetical protein
MAPHHQRTNRQVASCHHDCAIQAPDQFRLVDEQRRLVDRRPGLLLMLVVIHLTQAFRRCPLTEKAAVCSSAACAGLTKNSVLKSRRCSSYRTPLSENGVRETTGSDSLHNKTAPARGWRARAIISHRTPSSGRHPVRRKARSSHFSSNNDYPASAPGQASSNGSRSANVRLR